MAVDQRDTQDNIISAKPTLEQTLFQIKMRVNESDDEDEEEEEKTPPNYRYR